MMSWIGGMVALGVILGLWDVETDDRSPNFGKIRIGNMRIDPWGGYQQLLVFVFQLFHKTAISSITGQEYPVGLRDSLWNFFEKSKSPLAGMLVELYSGKTYKGEVSDIKNLDQWIDRVVPFTLQDIYEAFKESDLPPVVSMPLTGILGWLGVGVQSYTGDWKDNFKKLGVPKYQENLIYGLTDPPYTTEDFWADTASQFKGVDPATLTRKKGFPPYIKAIVEAKLILDTLKNLPNEKLISINADPLKGTTFMQYHQMWLDREKIVASGDEKKLKEFDEKYPNAELGNITQRQYALLMLYHLITDKKKQAEFLDAHPELSLNPRQEYLRTHPVENAELAIWGQASILTMEAYKEFKKLLTEYDIPDSAIPELTLPPEGSIDTHFKYEEMVSDGTHGSWEAKLLLLEDAEAAKEAGVQSYAEWHKLTLSDTPIAALELKTEKIYRETYNKLNDTDYLDTLDDKIKDTDGLTERDRYRNKLKTTKIGDQTYIDIDRRITAIEKGTDKAPIPDEIVNAYVAHMKIVDETSGNSAEAKLNRYDNPAFNDFLMNADYWGESKAKPLLDPSTSKEEQMAQVAIWGIDKDWRKEDTWYDEGISEKHKNIPNWEARDKAIADERASYLAANTDYRKARRKREAYQKDIPEKYIENYVEYYELPEKGYSQEYYLFNHLNYYRDVWLGILKKKRVSAPGIGDIGRVGAGRMIYPSLVFPEEK